MGDRLSTKDLALVVCVALLWGYNFVPLRVALDEVPPLALAALRFFLAAIPAVFLVRRPAASWPTVVAYGLAIGVGQFGLIFLALALGFPAGLASLVTQTQVFFTIGLWAWMSRALPRAHQVVGTAVAAAGIVVLATARMDAGVAVPLAGFLLILGGAFSWAVGNVVAKRAAAKAPLDTFSLVVWASLAAPIPLAVLSFLTEGGLAPIDAIVGMSWRAWASVAVMTYGATLFAFAAWNRLLHTYPPAIVTPFALLIPVAGLGSAWIWLGETLSPLQFAGGALVMAGLALNVLVRTKRTTLGGEPPKPPLSA